MTEQKPNTGVSLLIAITIAVSAFISFSLQPMIGKILLPQAGGSPATWNSAMMVYQMLLLAGYLWAAILAKLRVEVQAGLHIALALLCPVATFLAPVTVNADAQALYYTIPGAIMQIAGIGMLFLFAQGPLLQSWYSRVAPGQNPYRLYAASNLGSFGGLIAYPLLLEPYTDLVSQTIMYRNLFSVAILATVAIGIYLLWKGPAQQQEEQEGSSKIRTKATWAVIPFITTGLMMAVTTHITTDIAAMPLTWAVPLGIYLLSYSLAFSDRHVPRSTRLIVFALMFMAAISFGGIKLNWIAVGLELLCYAIVITMLHRQLYDARPEPRHLTGYYLHMAFGGAAAGIAIGIVAPQIFDWLYELPLFVAAAVYVLRVKTTEPTISNQRMINLIWGLAIVMAALSAIVSFFSQGSDYLSAIIAVIIAINAGALSGYTRRTVLFLTALAMVAGGAFTQLGNTLRSDQHRNYFGITRVVHTTEHGRKLKALLHGTTMHGVQALDETGRPTTTTYYGPESGITSILTQYNRPVTATVLGLGAGTTACTFPEGSRLTYIEIDPDMVDIANKEFTFLQRCNRTSTRIIVGDGRQKMKDLTKGLYDIVLMDAFSSDAIPTHLITKEALDLARSVLKPDGMLVIHVSNRYLDLAPMLAAYAKSSGLEAREKNVEVDARTLQAASNYVAIAPRAVMNEHAPAEKGWKEPQRQARMWTDAYSSVVQALR